MSTANSAMTVEATCETMYAAWTTAQKNCRSYHICNASNTDAGNMTSITMMHCPHAQPPGGGVCP